MKPTEVEIRDAMNLMDMLFSLGFRKAISYKKKDENGYKYTELGWYDWVEENKWFYNGDLFCARGETKVCIWREDYDWVIKVAYRRETNPWYIERESTDRPLGQGCHRGFLLILEEPQHLRGQALSE